MIEITMNTARNKLTITGHATPEESGQYKEICSAVSALAQGLVYSINKINEDEKALVSMKYRNDPGNLLLKVVPEEWADRIVKKRFSIYGDGMELMARAHGGSVSMIWDGERIIADKEEGTNE